jgi:hypothetical protein
VSALSLNVLRKRIMVVALQGRKAREEVAVTLLLDSAAQRECDRRRGCGGAVTTLHDYTTCPSHKCGRCDHTTSNFV